MKISTAVFDPTALQREESVYRTANGYLGVRANFEEGVPDEISSVRGCYINGFYDNVDYKYPEKLYGFPDTAQRMVNLPDTQTTRLFINGEEFSLFTGDVIEFSRTLHMDLGVVTRNVTWRSPKGNKLRITFTRMTSFLRKELFLTQIRIEGEGELYIESELNCNVFNFVGEKNPRAASERDRHIHMRSAEISAGRAIAICNTSKSELQTAVAMGHSFNRPCEPKTSLMPDGIRINATFKLEEGPVVIDKFCVYSDSRRQSNCQKRALAVLDRAMSDGVSALFSEQKLYLFDFWNRCNIKIYGNDGLNESMAYNLYGLLQSAGNDGLGNITAKGLSGECCDGHYFGDTEIYMLPFFMLTRPEHAKTLLDYRYSILGSAKEHARLLGHNRGALYPGRTITGSECSGHYPSGSAQYHITGDVAHSFLQYYYVTGDLGFMEKKGAEVIVETARLWMDTVVYDRQGRLCINDITGPDEYTCIVNNNYFTNLTAKHNLLGAVYICEELKKADRFDDFAKSVGVTDEELKSFVKAADDIYIPYDEELDLNPQDDSFLDKAKLDLKSIPKENFPLLLHYHPLWLYRHQVCKQADTVLAHYLYEDADESTMKNSYEYYEEITTHDSALSTCIFSIMASRLGMPEKAYDYFMRSVRADLDDVLRDTKDGVHTAHMGGAYLALIAGFAGLRIKEEGLNFHFTLPKSWNGYEFSLMYKDSLFRVYVNSGGAEFTLKSGEPVTVFVDGREYRLGNDKIIVEQMVDSKV